MDSAFKHDDAALAAVRCWFPLIARAGSKFAKFQRLAMIAACLGNQIMQSRARKF